MWASGNKQRHLAQLMHTTHRPAGVGMPAAIATRPPTADIVTQGDQDMIVAKNRNFLQNKIEIFFQNNCC